MVLLGRKAKCRSFLVERIYSYAVRICCCNKLAVMFSSTAFVAKLGPKQATKIVNQVLVSASVAAAHLHLEARYSMILRKLDRQF